MYLIFNPNVCRSSPDGTKLIDDLLDVSRIIVGKIALEMVELNPVEIILKAVESQRLDAEKKSIHINSAFDSWSGTVLADPLRLQQVFSNLISNAVKFSSPHSTIDISVKRKKVDGGELAKAIIAVRDSGKGIKPDFLPHIFDRFSQEDSSSIKLHGGLGLGLAIVKNIVELHGGAVRAESPGENLGATFTVILPLKSESKPPIEKFPVNKLASSYLKQLELEKINLRGLRVLVVDDDLATRDVLIEILQFYGANVRGAFSVENALKVFKEFKPQVLVSDIGMPEEDGYSLIRKIRALSPAEGSIVPALALTAFASNEDKKLALKSGFNLHLAKPIDGQILAKTILELAYGELVHG